jgi:hypothetical protein
MPPEIQSEWSGITPPDGFLDGEAKAPVPLPSLEPEAYRRVLSSLVEGLGFPGGPRDTALASAVVYFGGAQRIVELGNRFIQEDFDRGRNQATLVQLLRCFLVLDRERAAAYVLEQIALHAAAKRPPPEDRELPRRRRLADLMSPVEERLTRLGVPAHLDLPLFAALLVHLDDLYDDAVLQLLRFFRLVREPLEVARSLAGPLLGSLYGDFVRASLGDHLLGGEIPPKPKGDRPEGAERGGEAEPRSKTGLLSVLPLAIEAIEAGA